jgi:hypothetical protein
MANTFVLELDGKPAGRLIAVDSPGIRTEVLANQQPPGLFDPKIQTPITVGNIDVKIGADASRPLLDWLAAGPAGIISRKHGAINVLDARSVVVSRIEFHDALITSVTIPALDRSSQTPAYFKASFRPTRMKRGAGGNKLSSGAPVLPAQKPWNTSNFRFKIGGLPNEDGAITKVSAISLKSNPKEFYSGLERFPDLIPAPTSHSSLVVSVSRSKGSRILSWVDDAIGTRSMPTQNGTLEFLGPGNGSRYFAIDFTRLDVVSKKLPSDRSRGDEVYLELSYDSLRLVY